MKRIARWASDHLPENLMVFIAAIFLSNSVNEFTTIYAVPGRPVVSFGLIFSCAGSLLAAGFWTALAAKKESIEKAVASGASSLVEREELRDRMWDGVWLRMLVYLSGAVVLSLLGLIVLVLPGG